MPDPSVEERLAINEVRIEHLSDEFKDLEPLKKEIYTSQASTQVHLDKAAQTLNRIAEIQETHTIALTTVTEQMNGVMKWKERVTTYALGALLMIMIGSLSYWMNNHDAAVAVKAKAPIEFNKGIK